MTVSHQELPGFGACIAGFGLVKPTLVPSSPSMHHDDPKDIFAFGNPSTTMDCAASVSFTIDVHLSLLTMKSIQEI